MLEDLNSLPTGLPCRIRTLTNELEGNDPKILLDAVEGNTWKVGTLVRELRTRGILVSETSVSKHRRRECSCFNA